MIRKPHQAHRPPETADDLADSLDVAELSHASLAEVKKELGAEGFSSQALVSRFLEFERTAGSTANENPGGFLSETLRKFVQFPSWIQDWQIQLATASGVDERQLWMKLGEEAGLPGSLEFKLEPRVGDDGKGALLVAWEASFFSENGWVLQLYLQGDDTPAFRSELGDAVRGQALFTTEQLGFDPLKTPFQCGFGPKSAG
jgi:hypothetical protein